MKKTKREMRRFSAMLLVFMLMINGVSMGISAQGEEPVLAEKQEEVSAEEALETETVEGPQAPVESEIQEASEIGDATSDVDLVTTPDTQALTPLDTSVFDSFSNVYQTEFGIYLNQGERIAIEWNFIRKAGHNLKMNMDYVFTSPVETRSLSFSQVSNTTSSANSNQVFFGSDANRTINGADLESNPEINAFDGNDPTQWLEVDVSGIHTFKVQETSNITGNFRFHIMNAQGEPIQGRTWSEHLSLTQSENKYETFQYFHMMIDGYIYSQTVSGFNGQNSSIMSDAAGLVEKGDRNCAPVFESALKKGDGSFKSDDLGILTYILASEDDTCQDKVTHYKIFSSMPNSDLPSEAYYPNGADSTWLRQLIALPQYVSMDYTRTTHNSQAIDIAVEVNNYEGTLEIWVDTNNNGSIDDAVDVMLSTIYRKGEPTTLSWDGLNGLGDRVPMTQEVKLFSEIDRSGEIHFVGWDIEDLRVGTKIERLNGLQRPLQNESLIYWDHRAVDDRISQNCGFNGPVSALEGIVSNNTLSWRRGTSCIYTSVDGLHEGNAQYFGAPANQGKSFGDLAYIHEWTYETLQSPVKAEKIIPALNPYFPIEKTVSEASGDGVLVPDEIFTYIIKTHNDGSKNEDIIIIDPLTEVWDHIDLSASQINVKRNGILVPGYTLQNLRDGIAFLNMLAVDANGNPQDAIEIELKLKASASVATIPAPHEIANTATVTWDVEVTDPSGGITTETFENEASASIVTGKADFTITKSVKDLGSPNSEIHLVDGIVSPGEKLEYTISLENTETSNLMNLMIKDDITQFVNYIKEKGLLDTVVVNIEFTNLDGQSVGSSVNTPGAISLETLVQGLDINLYSREKIELKFELQANDSLKGIRDARFLNSVSASLGKKVKKAEITIPIGVSELVITKSVDHANKGGKLQQGEAISYTLEVQNVGTAALFDVEILDEMDRVLPYISETPEDVVVTMKQSGIEKEYTLEDLIAGIILPRLVQGEVSEFKFTVSLKPDLNVLEIPDYDNDGIIALHNIAYADWDASEEIIIPFELPELEITKQVVNDDGSSEIVPKDSFTYTITVKNKGKMASINTLISDPLTEVLKYVNESSKLSDVVLNHRFEPNGANPILSSLNQTSPLKLNHLVSGLDVNLMMGESIVLHFTLSAKDDLSAILNQSIVNTATAKNTLETVSAQASILAGQAVLDSQKRALDQNGDGIVEPGETLTYTLASTNKANFAAKNVIFKDELTDVLAHIKETPAQVSVVSSQGKTHTLEDLITGIKVDLIAPQETVTLTFTVTLRPDLDVSQMTEASDGNIYLRNVSTVNDLMSPEVLVPIAKPKLNIAKTVDHSSIEAGQTHRYTIRIENEGKAISYRTSIKDDLKELLPYIKPIEDQDTVRITSSKVGSKDYKLKDLVSGTLSYDLLASEVIELAFDINYKDSFKETIAQGKTLTNTASVTNAYETLNATQTLPMLQGAMTLQKVVHDLSGDGLVSAGEGFTYTLKAENVGNASLTSLTIKDDLASLISYVEDLGAVTVHLESSTKGSLGTQPLQTLIEGTLALSLDPGESISLSFELTLQQGILINSIENMTLVNTANLYLNNPQGEILEQKQADASIKVQAIEEPKPPITPIEPKPPVDPKPPVEPAPQPPLKPETPSLPNAGVNPDATLVQAGFAIALGFALITLKQKKIRFYKKNQ